MKFRLFCILVMLGTLSACAIKRDHYDTPEVDLPSSFRHTPNLSIEAAQAAAPLKSVLPDWWRLLGNPELDELVDRALANNLELRVASHRVVQAHARTAQARADQYPVLSLPYSASSTAPGEGAGTRQTGSDLNSKRSYQAVVRAAWRPDLWGEVKAMYESADLQLWRTMLARDDVQRALVANVVSTYAGYLSLSDRIRIAEESEALLSNLLASVRDRMDGGDATIIEFEQQRSALFQVRATIPLLNQQREQARNQLAILVGTVPRSIHLSNRGLDTLSTPVVVPGLPSSLLLRRPDVRTIEATMLAADANIDVARARILPQLDITAQYGVGGFNFSQLFNPNQLLWNALGNLTATIFDYGKRAKDVAIARSVHEELTETYAMTLYNAVREVEDAQAALDAISKRSAFQKQSVTAAQSAWTYSRESYEAGAIDHMVLLDTERTYHARLDEYSRIQLDNVLALTNLFQALGGGVDSSAALPGKGKRPVPPPDVAAGLVQAVLPPSGPAMTLAPMQLVDGKGKRWLAELPGVTSFASAMATRRDLIARFPDLMTRQRLVLVRQEAQPPGNAGHPGTAWYRIFVGSFSEERASQEFCSVLKKQFMRCNTLANSAPALSNGGKWLQIGEVASEENVAIALPPIAPSATLGAR